MPGIHSSQVELPQVTPFGKGSTFARSRPQQSERGHGIVVSEHAWRLLIMIRKILPPLELLPDSSANVTHQNANADEPAGGQARPSKQQHHNVQHEEHNLKFMTRKRKQSVAFRYQAYLARSNSLLADAGPSQQERGPSSVLHPALILQPSCAWVLRQDMPQYA